MEIHTAELLVSEPSPFEVEIATANLKSTNREVLLKLRQD
jgi:hypothetical protein